MSTIVTRTLRPVTGANESGTVVVAFSPAWSAIGGSVSSRTSPSTSSRMRVGTECRPSATTARSMWSNVIGAASVVVDVLAAHLVERRLPRGGEVAVDRRLGATPDATVGRDSLASDAHDRRIVRRRLRRARRRARPHSASLVARAVPVSANARAGRQRELARDRRFGIVTRRDRHDAIAAHDDDERVVERARPGRVRGDRSACARLPTPGRDRRVASSRTRTSAKPTAFAKPCNAATADVQVGHLDLELAERPRCRSRSSGRSACATNRRARRRSVSLPSKRTLTFVM